MFSTVVVDPPLDARAPFSHVLAPPARDGELADCHRDLLLAKHGLDVVRPLGQLFDGHFLLVAGEGPLLVVRGHFVFRVSRACRKMWPLAC
eukprot:15449848-Alexandrium_andersonii.AAC.1